MNYKLRSLIYLFAFIFSALLYYQVEQSENVEENDHVPELTSKQTKENPENKKEVVL
ncbi:MAG: hypothetical protein P8Z38_06680 [Robiginitalea sp.]